MDKSQVYKVKRRTSTTHVCKSLISFDYKTGSSGSPSTTFQYKECDSGLINTVTFPLTNTSGEIVTFDATDYSLCFEEGTLVRIAGISLLTNFVYGDCVA
jgi:hypothetical protein